MIMQLVTIKKSFITFVEKKTVIGNNRERNSFQPNTKWTINTVSFSAAGHVFKCTEHKDEFCTSFPLLLGSWTASKFCQVILLSKCNLKTKKSVFDKKER